MRQNKKSKSNKYDSADEDQIISEQIRAPSPTPTMTASNSPTEMDSNTLLTGTSSQVQTQDYEPLLEEARTEMEHWKANIDSTKVRMQEILNEDVNITPQQMKDDARIGFIGIDTLDEDMRPYIEANFFKHMHWQPIVGFFEWTFDVKGQSIKMSDYVPPHSGRSMWIPVFLTDTDTYDAQTISVGRTEFLTLLRRAEATDMTHEASFMVPPRLQTRQLNGRHILAIAKREADWDQIDQGYLITAVTIHHSRLANPTQRMTEDLYIAPLLLNEDMMYCNTRGDIKRANDEIDAAIKRHFNTIIKQNMKAEDRGPTELEQTVQEEEYAVTHEYVSRG